MSGYNHFDYVPSTVGGKRSVFKVQKNCARSAYLGWLYPVCKPFRMMPGSTLSLDLAAEIRSVAMMAPLMDELYCDFFAFSVKNRIVWEHWKQFVGAVDDVLFNNLTQYEIPSFRFGLAQNSGGSNDNDFVSGSENFQWNQTIACHFGLQYPGSTSQSYAARDAYPYINALPFRGYTFIWNMFFRPEQLVAPLVFSKGDVGNVGQNIEACCGFTGMQPQLWNGTNIYIPYPHVGLDPTDPTMPVLGGAILPTYRVHRSLWTSCLPYPSLETLNLLTDLTAPVGVNFDVAHTMAGGESVTLATQNTSYGQTTAKGFNGIWSVSSVSDLNHENVIADLSQAMLTVNNYRETIMLQNYYDVLNRAGSRYDELLFNIFKTRPSNAVSDIPELIVHKRFTIYRNQVVATATGMNSTDQDGSFLGSQSGYIDTIVRDNFFTVSTNEHGYIHLLYTIRPAHIRMSSGIEPEWEELKKFDLYYPQFDGMGDVPRYGREIFYDFTISSDNQKAVFGYQEYGATWKYERSDAAGFLDENTPNPIIGYTLTEKMSSAPGIVVTNYNFLGYVSCFMECEAFSRCLKISNPLLSPHFILDIRLNGTVAHPMPVYNIPGQGELL